MPREPWRDDGERDLPVELVDIRIGELSRVRRGATGREFLMLKSLPAGRTPLEKVRDVATMCPAPREEGLNEVLKAAGVSQKGRTAAVALARLLRGYADVLTPEVLDVVEDVLARGGR